MTQSALERNPDIHFINTSTFYGPLNVRINGVWLFTCIHTYISPNFWKHTSKRSRIFAQEPGDSQVSGYCGEKET